MKIKQKTAIALLCLVGLCTAGCDMGGNTNADVIKVWCAENLVELTKEQLNKFKDNNPSIEFEYKIEAVGEADAATKMITDVSAGGDVYCFAQDQISRLVTAGALTAIEGTTKEDITSQNDEGSVRAATVGDKLYAYPLTSDNGYFMYYDKSVVPESALNDQTMLIDVVNRAGKQINFELVGSGWYNSSYFFGAGCTIEWKIDKDGKFTECVDTFNSDRGKIALRGMAELIGSPVFINNSQAANMTDKTAVLVTGTWDYNTAKDKFKDNLGCAKLWSYTIDGNSYQLGSFSGNKLIGVKPQKTAQRDVTCQLIATYLSSESAQRERFERAQWGPSNKVVQADSGVQANVALAALNKQNVFATPQGQFPDGWWNISKAMAIGLQALKTPRPLDSDITKILNSYQSGLDEIIK